MKWLNKISSLTVLVFCFLASMALANDPDPSGADVWTQSVTNGFGNPAQNLEISWLQNFNGHLYAAVNTSGSGAQLFRSSDLTNWTAVGPALVNSANKINRMTANGNSDLYMNVNTGASTPALYRSTNGTSWTLINTGANGFTNTNIGSLSGLAVRGTNLFAGLRSVGSAGQIWRSGLDGTNFTLVADFTTGLNINTGANTNLNFISYLYAAANGNIYVPMGNRGPTGNAEPIGGFAFLYESTDGGAHWTKNTGVGSGFGNTNNLNIASMTEFGGYLYASVNNPTTGGELWRTPFNAGNNFNDSVWQQVIAGGVDDSLNYELHHVSADNGYLWLTTSGVPASGSGPTSPDEIWRSSDGVNWVQSNLAGFGDPTNQVSRYPAIAGFGSHEVFGGRRPPNGAQIFVTTAPPPTPAIFSASGNVITVTWSATATNVVLEAATNLAPSISWSTVTNAVQTTNGMLTVEISVIPASRFFRLKR